VVVVRLAVVLGSDFPVVLVAVVLSGGSYPGRCIPDTNAAHLQRALIWVSGET